MPYFLFPGKLKLQEIFEINGPEVRHIRQSRKIRIGERICLQDEQEKRYSCEVREVFNRHVVFYVFEEVATPPPSQTTIDLYITSLKEKPTDFILQKATELGVSSINFFQSHYSAKLPHGPHRKAKEIRWNKIMQEACKQCERVSAPALRFIGSLNESLSSIPAASPVLIFDQEKSADSFANLPFQKPEISLFIGPEGGFAENELEVTREIQKIFLGPRVLRSETAAIAALTLTQYHLGDMGDMGVP